MGCHGNHAFSHSKNKCFRTIFSQIGGQMNNLAHMRNYPEGCMVDQIRSRGNYNLYLSLFSVIHDLDLIKKTDKNCFRCLDLILRVTARSKFFIYATKY